MANNSLRLLLDFDDRIQRDREQPPAFLHRRDRRFALDCQQQGITPGAGQWLAHMDRLSGSGGDVNPGTRELQRWQQINTGFAVVGSIFGIITMLGLLFYDGGQRINITVFLAFVLLHLLLALATTTQALIGWQPWAWLARRLKLDTLSPTKTRLQPLFMARAAHNGGAAFAVTGLLTLLAMVVVQDLAFGWSTTLDTASASYHGLVNTIATPWAWLWQAASPSPELVEATRFFRAAPATPAIDPARWGQWWPFVTMVWFFWVLLPRLTLWAASQLLLQSQARTLLARHPGMQALQYRMETPTLDTGSGHNDASDLPDTHTLARPQTIPVTPVLIGWAGAGDEPAMPASLHAEPFQLLKAGGRASLAEDEAVLTRAGNQLAALDTPEAIVLSKSWEPPTGELYDFLTAAHENWPAGARIVLVPLAAQPDRQPAEHLLQPWLRFTERLPDGFATVALPTPDEPAADAPGRTQP